MGLALPFRIKNITRAARNASPTTTPTTGPTTATVFSGGDEAGRVVFEAEAEAVDDDVLDDEDEENEDEAIF